MADSEMYTLRYRVTDRPPLATILLFGFQQIIVCASGIISTPLVITNLLCASENAMARVKLMSTTLFVTGFSTIAQTTCGVRLPMMQGPSFAFIVPIIAFMKLPEFQCPDFHNSTANISKEETDSMMNDAWLSRMQIVQGALVSCAVIEMLIGFTGIVGVFTKFIGPLTIAPLMICLEISISSICVQYLSEHWISILTILLLLTTALYLHQVNVPLPVYRRQSKQCTVTKFPLFSVFPYLIAIFIVWIICAILTATDVFDVVNNKAARTDVRQFVITEAPWFSWPYPGQWGPINFNVGLFLGMIAATLASIVESIGDYHACARTCQEPHPPPHAMNRGIGMEGLCSIFGGLLGVGVNVTTYSENVGVLGITKVASKTTMQAAGLMFILLGIFTKFGAVLATIPNPIVGGILTVSCAMVGGVGLSSVQSIDLRLSRNAAVLGLAIILGIIIPSYIEEFPISTGVQSLDQLLNILFGIHMFVAGTVGFILDNTLPGASREQRGLKTTSTKHEDSSSVEKENVYSFDPFVTKILNKIPCLGFLPFLPKFHSGQTATIMPLNNKSFVTKF